jgi:L-serine dehydratase
MEFVSIFNDVLGPVMRGPSSSHTAGSYRIGRMARALLGEEPVSAIITFPPSGSYARVYRQQGADLAFAAGLMQWSITDSRFPDALQAARNLGIKLEFKVELVTDLDHPNTVVIDMVSQIGKKLHLEACSVGGGAVSVMRLGDWPLTLSGKSYDYLIECDSSAENQVMESGKSLVNSDKTVRRHLEDKVLLHFQASSDFCPSLLTKIKDIPGVRNTWKCDPVFCVRKGEEIFSSSEQMVRLAEERRCSLGQLALEYEAAVLGNSKRETLEEMARRFEVMRSSVNRGLSGESIQMQLLEPSAGRVYQVEKSGEVTVGGIHTRAAARAMAVMHVINSHGVVCAAPTGGSAGVIPGVVVTLAEEKSLEAEEAAMLLFASSAIGLIIARRATFAAEIAGCQVEIGAAAAMAAAAVVEFARGSAQQAADAAAISLQNTMGSVCDLVQGMCEIPCHTRNAVASSNAFVCADLILGGYQNPIPLDETIDAVYAVGRMLPRELRCTALGGLAQTPSAQTLSRKK